MLKRTFTYVDYDGNERNDTWFFGLSEAEVAKIQLGTYVGLEALLKQLMDNKNGLELVEILDQIIMTSVGQKSLDGRQFIKNQQLRDEFRQTDSYNQLFMEIATDEAKAAEFFNAITPPPRKKPTDHQPVQASIQ